MGFDPSFPNSPIVSPPTSRNVDPRLSDGWRASQQQFAAEPAPLDVGGPRLRTDVYVQKQPYLAPMTEGNEGSSASSASSRSRSAVGSPDKGPSVFSSGSGVSLTGACVCHQHVLSLRMRVLNYTCNPDAIDSEIT